MPCHAAAANDANSLASDEVFKAKAFLLISQSSQAIQLNSTNLQLLLSTKSQISATLSFLLESIAWLDIDISTLQITIINSLQTKIEKLNILLLTLQSGGGSSGVQLSESETTTLVTGISNLTSLLKGYGQSYYKYLVEQ